MVGIVVLQKRKKVFGFGTPRRSVSYKIEARRLIAGEAFSKSACADPRSLALIKRRVLQLGLSAAGHVLYRLAYDDNA
jgi:hypothetical protein